MTRIEFDVKINWFLEFYGVVMTKLQCDVWFKIFGKLKPEELQNAFDWHIAHDQYNSLPAPGKITVALEALEEERLSKPPPYPEFTTLWVRVIERFPEKQNYEHYPPESDTASWKALYDQVVRIPPSLQAQAVEKAMRELEAKFK
jgi:hypothetical protein